MAAGPPKYLIDTNSINEVDGAHRDNNPPTYSNDEQDRIWAGLISLFESGRARMVSYVKAELEDLNVEAYRKLRGYRAVRETNSVVTRYQEVNRRFPGWVDEDPRREPPDPWMVAYAAEQDWHIVTEEVRDANQFIKRTRPKIPDAADAFGVRCLNITELTRDEGWLA